MAQPMMVVQLKTPDFRLKCLACAKHFYIPFTTEGKDLPYRVLNELGQCFTFCSDEHLDLWRKNPTELPALLEEQERLLAQLTESIQALKAVRDAPLAPPNQQQFRLRVAEPTAWTEWAPQEGKFLPCKTQTPAMKTIAISIPPQQQSVPIPQKPQEPDPCEDLKYLTIQVGLSAGFANRLIQDLRTYFTKTSGCASLISTLPAFDCVNERKSQGEFLTWLQNNPTYASVARRFLEGYMSPPPPRKSRSGHDYDDLSRKLNSLDHPALCSLIRNLKTYCNTRSYSHLLLKIPGAPETSWDVKTTCQQLMAFAVNNDDALPILMDQINTF
jgi:hypothetical protein